MKKNIFIILFVFLFILSGCSAKKDAQSKQASTNQQNDTKRVEAKVVLETINAESLKGNLLGDDTKVRITITLPSSYDKSNSKYPVLYFFHGFGNGNGVISSKGNDLAKQMLKSGNKEFIIVEPYIGLYFGSNSPVIGNWEDCITKEIVNCIDQKYRTIPKAEARGIAGFSMGGSVAINLGLKHPDIFSSIYALSPGLFDENGLKNAMDTWDGQFKDCYGAAFSPNVKIANPYANIPKFDNSAEDNKIVQNWESGFGNLKNKINAYKALNTPLTAIKLSCGKNDIYGWIFTGTQYCSKLLTDAGIKNELEINDCSHEIDVPFYDSECVDFFSKNLSNK